MSDRSDATPESLPLQFVKGVGPRRAEALAADGIITPTDVLWRVPRGYVDRTAAPTISSLLDRTRSTTLWDSSSTEIANVTGEVSILASVYSVQEKTVGRGKKMLTAEFGDDSGATVKINFWGGITYFKKLLVQDASFVVSGIPEFDAKWNQLTFNHPELEPVDAEDLDRFQGGAILAKYSVSQRMRAAGITMKLLRSIVLKVIDTALASEGEFLPPDIVRKHDLMDRITSLRELHFPTSLSNVERARRRMKFEELFLFQLFLATKQRSKKASDLGIKMDPKSPRARTLIDGLNFELTGAQKRVINEIVGDMKSGLPMNRLLQGDVGSGKTIVALLCMLNVVDNGYQTVLMAPTEILAEQHQRSIAAMCEGTDLQVDLLVGGLRKKARNEVLSRITSGETNIIVGTHALFQADVEYHKLAFIVIDEQHRFGVAQRSELRRLGRSSHGDDNRAPHILVMSATPIPRTLSMTLYGDLDVSVIDELPANRRLIETRVVFESSLPGVHEFIREQVKDGRQVYIIYPLVEKSEKLELKSAVEHYDYLATEIFPELNVGLLHGQLLWYEKEEAMGRFLNREYDILVATTVVEVGVDVPNATVMLIENAERFGLSQLHQLRGRVGRSAHQSYCFLATKDHFRFQMTKKSGADERLSAAVRLRTMEETGDGFKIAEVDLKLRGPGDLMGTRQSGVPEFSFADLSKDGDIISTARSVAFELIADDPHLRKPDHSQLRTRLVESFESGTYTTVA